MIVVDDDHVVEFVKGREQTKDLKKNVIRERERERMRKNRKENMK